MCKAGGKLFSKWYRLDCVKELIKDLETDVHMWSSGLDFKSENMVIGNLVDIKKGGNDKYSQGSWIHPDLAVQLAQWISPKFAIQVSRWIRELAITGSVSVGQKKTSQQLLDLQRQLLEEKNKIKKLEIKHNNMLLKRTVHKFKKGPILYLISRVSDGKTIYKVGIDDIDINKRLAQHRTTCPELRLEYLIYTTDNKLLESIVLRAFKDEREPYGNHEWIFGVNLDKIVRLIETQINILDLEVNREENMEQYNDIVVNEI
jgi:hypothetical protein